MLKTLNSGVPFLEQLTLMKVHALNDVMAVVEHTVNALSVHSASEVGVAVVVLISTGSADSQKHIADELLGLCQACVLSRLRSSSLRSSIVSKFWKVVIFDFQQGLFQQTGLAC